MKKILFTFLFSGFLIAGCGNVTAVITNFDDCVKAGNPVMESYPRQCSTPEGEVFVEDVEIILEPEPVEICEDMCGDGICQEIVCMAIGCPCAETAESCPEDCE